MLACCNDFDFLNEEKYFYKERNAFVLLRRNDIPLGEYTAHLAVHRASWNIQTRVIALISSHYCPWYHPTSVLKFSSEMFSFSIVLISFPQTMLLISFCSPMTYCCPTRSKKPFWVLPGLPGAVHVVVDCDFTWLLKVFLNEEKYLFFKKKKKKKKEMLLYY